jgi:hypothetical protein
MNPDVPPVADKVFRCAVCGTKVGSISGGKFRTRMLPMECPTHGVLADPNPEQWIKEAWRQHARHGNRITIKLSPIK